MIDKVVITDSLWRFVEASRIGSRAFGYGFPDLFLFAGGEIGEEDRAAAAEALVQAANSTLSEQAIEQFWWRTETFVGQPVRPFTLQVAELLTSWRPPGPPPLG